LIGTHCRGSEAADLDREVQGVLSESVGGRHVSLGFQRWHRRTNDVRNDGESLARFEANSAYRMRALQNFLDNVKAFHRSDKIFEIDRGTHETISMTVYIHIRKLADEWKEGQGMRNGKLKRKICGSDGTKVL
jgi:hypothetical protein